MRGSVRPIPSTRRLIIDMMGASEPLAVVKRTMKLDRLATAWGSRADHPGWAAMVAKAFCIVARDEPLLRTFYLKWPWPRFYELPKSIAMIAVNRDDIGRDLLVFLKLGTADEMSLEDLQAIVLRSKNAPIAQTRSLERLLRLSRLPFPLRKLLIFVGRNVGRQRANFFGTVAISSVAALGADILLTQAPGPSLITYGRLQPDHTMELLLHWDHRIYDGTLVARSLQRLEQVLNTEIADELLADACRSGSA